MEGFIWSLIVCTLGASLAAVLLLILEKPLARRYAPDIQYALWLVVLAGFLILWRPVVFRLPLLAPAQPAETYIAAPAVTLSERPRVRPAPTEALVPAQIEESTKAEPIAPAPMPQRRGIRLSPLQKLLIVYLPGVLGVLLWTAARHIRFLRDIRPWLKPVKEGPLLGILKKKQTQLSIKQHIPLYLCPRVDSPMLLGLLRPRLLVPGTHYTEEELSLIFHHELIHLKRGDVLIKYLSVLALALNWFNPFAWLAAHRAGYYCEVSCDARVVDQQSMETRAQYSYAILSGLRKARQGTALSTGFMGGKNDMKNRIAAIMERSVNKRSLLPILALGLMLMLSGFTLAEAPNPEVQKDFPREAYIHSPIATSAGLCEISDDYEMPAAVYFNGVKVKVLEIEKSLGGYPRSLNDPTEMWGKVIIETGTKGMEVSGWVPQICLQYINENPDIPAKLPVGTLKEDVQFRLDNGLTEDLLGEIKQGTAVTLLGIMDTFYHVQVEGKAGFIPRDTVEFDKDNQVIIDKGQPECGEFSYIMPGHELRFEEYQSKQQAIFAMPDEDVPYPELIRKARLSALSLEYNLPYTDEVHILPGKEDMDPDEVIRLGEKLLKEKYGYTDADILGLEVEYYYKPENKERHFWRVRLHAWGGMGNLLVEMDDKGNPLEYFQAKAFPVQEVLTQEEEKLAQQSIDYYHIYPTYPMEGDIDRDTAIERAKEKLQSLLPEGGRMEDFSVQSATFHRYNKENLSWWRVAFRRADVTQEEIMIEMVVPSPEGDIITSDMSYFLRNYGDILKERQGNELTQERDDFDTGTREQKAEVPDAANQKDFPQEAYIHSPIATSAGLCEISDDYEMPAAVYFNGVKVKVLEIEKSLGGYPQSLNDPTEMWGKVIIETGTDGMEVSGWVPQICLQYIKDDPSLPAELPAGTLAHETALRKDTGLTDAVLGTYPKGTPLQLLGSMQDYHHVMVEGKAGFIPVDALALDERNADIIAKGQPETQMFGDVMPGHFDRYREYQEKLTQIIGITDDEGMNPSLENMAARSRLAQEYGYEYTSLIHLVPGKDDMDRDEVMALGDKLLREKYGYTDQDILGVSLSLYYKPEDPDTHYWKVGLYADNGKGNVTVEMDDKGNPLEYFQGKSFPAKEREIPSAEEIREQQKDIEYYTDYFYASYPREGDLDKEKALAIAWQRMGEAAAEGFTRFEYEVHNMTFHRHNRDNISWWLVAFKLKGQEMGNPLFFVVVTSPEGKVISSDAELYQSYSLNMRKESMRIKLEEEYGRPFMMWTVEEKAAFDPTEYALPRETDISKEEAREKALEYLKTVYAVTQEDIDSWTTAYTFLKDGQWYIDFNTEESIQDTTIPHYTVVLDAQDGEIVNVFDLNTNG